MIDLSPDQLRLVKRILNKHIPGKEVWVFGSRVGKAPKKHSDLDLAIMGEKPLSPKTMAFLRSDFSESRLPVKVDLLDWAEISEDFRNIILAKYEVIQKP